MALSSRTAWSGLVAVIALLVLQLQLISAQSAQPTPQLYCSDQNTGDEGGIVSQWEFQSQGNCKGNCSGNAFAIVQWDKCWCSNYIPADQQDVSNCNGDCPGFPDDKCGNKDEGLFGYYELSHKPSGTQGSSNPSSTEPSSAPPSPSPSSEAPTTVVQTVTQSPVVVTLTPPSQEPTSAPTTMQTSVVSDESSSAAISTSDPNSSSNRPSSTQQAPVSSVELTTINGVVSTRVIVITPTATSAPSENKGTPVGSISGCEGGGVVGIAAVVAGVLFLLWRRRKQQQEEGFQSGVARNTSTLSKSGLLRTEKASGYPTPIVTGSHRTSRMMDNESISPVSGSDRRNSRPYLFDQRMNPSAIMSMDNNSRGSFVSMDDSRDYGRTLNVRNPDPDPR